MDKDFRVYCTMCKDYLDVDEIDEEAHYGRQGEDTYDFRLCHKHEKELWKFLGEEADFSWEFEECEECGEEFKKGTFCEKCMGVESG